MEFNTMEERAESTERILNLTTDRAEIITELTNTITSDGIIVHYLGIHYDISNEVYLAHGIFTYYGNPFHAWAASGDCRCGGELARLFNESFCTRIMDARVQAEWGTRPRHDKAKSVNPVPYSSWQDSPDAQYRMDSYGTVGASAPTSSQGLYLRSTEELQPGQWIVSNNIPDLGQLVRRWGEVYAEYQTPVLGATQGGIAVLNVRSDMAAGFDDIDHNLATEIFQNAANITREEAEELSILNRVQVAEARLDAAEQAPDPTPETPRHIWNPREIGASIMRRFRHDPGDSGT